VDCRQEKWISLDYMAKIKAINQFEDPKKWTKIIVSGLPWCLEIELNRILAGASNGVTKRRSSISTC
jgi:hypothetical protein